MTLRLVSVIRDLQLHVAIYMEKSTVITADPTLKTNDVEYLAENLKRQSPS